MSLSIGDITLASPIMLAPMAGVTNPPFRQLCREFGEAGARAAGLDPSVQPEGTIPGTHAPAGLYVCEMITSRALIERVPETMTMIQPDPGDPVRSIQLYGVEPKNIARAVTILVEENWADHIDINFGCPVPKVTRKGGGSALPWKHDLFRDIVTGAVKAARAASSGRDHEIPVTAKFRVGIDDDHHTFREVARMSEDAGIAALTLHARTTAQHYSGTADWSKIAELKQLTTLPVFGNGDVFEAADAKDVMAQTGCDGVVVGRGCQGRPWLFFDLMAEAHGSAERYEPTLREVAEVIMRHAELSVAHFQDEHRAMRELRKHVGWYLRGFAVGGASRHELGLIDSLDDLAAKLSHLDLDQPFPEAASGPRGRAGSPKRPHLPEFWLDSHELNDAQRAKIHEAELGVSGG